MHYQCIQESLASLTSRQVNERTVSHPPEKQNKTRKNDVRHLIEFTNVYLEYMHTVRSYDPQLTQQ